MAIFKLRKKFDFEKVKSKVPNDFHGDGFQDERPEPKRSLADGRILPPKLAAAFDKALAGKLIEDIDPYYQNEQTFVVINKCKEIFRFTSAPALGLLSPFNLIRRVSMAIMTHWLFFYGIMAIIALQLYTMTMPNSKPVEALDAIFTAIYTFELAIKVLARGFILNKHTYLRDPWNWLDFILVTLTYITMGVNLSNFAALRMARLLRVIRLLRLRVTGVSHLAAAFFRAFKNLKDVGIFLFCYLFVFAVVGLQIYMGVLTQKCILDFPEDGSEGEELHKNQILHYTNYANWKPGPYRPNEYQLCGHSPFTQCGEGYSCLAGYGANPDYDYTNFDSFKWSLLSSFRLMNRDFWEALMQQVLRTAGTWQILFFIFGIFMGTFFFIPLFVVTVVTSYAEVLKEAEEDLAEGEDEDSSEAADGATSPTDFQAAQESLSYIDKTPTSPSKDEKETVVVGSPDKSIASTTPSALTRIFGKNSIDPEDPESRPENANLTGAQKTMGDDEDRPSGPGWCSRLFDVCCIWDCGFPWKNAQKIIKSIVMNPFFDLFITIVLVIATFFMALDHYGLERNIRLQSTLKMGNYYFTIIFAIEAAMRIIALSPKFYFGVGWNRFDFIVAVLPLIELIYEDVNLPGIYALRSFRLLRIFRLAQFWPSTTIKIIERIYSGLWSLVFVEFVIICTFALLGMQLFEMNYFDKIDKFPNKEMPRWNFTDFWHSWMIVFRVICGEWIESMWDCMLVGDASCSLFFLTAAVVLNLVALYLYLALVLRVTYEVTVLQLFPDEPNRLRPALEQLRKAICCVNLTKSGAKVVDSQLDKPTTAGVDVTIEMTLQGSENDKDMGTDKIENSESPTISKRGVDPSGEPLVVEADESAATKLDTGTFGKIRSKVAELIESKYFEAGIMIAVFLSCISLAHNDIHLKDNPKLTATLTSLDRVFHIFFLIEMLVKWVGLGFRKYFSNGWCRFEFFIVIVTNLNLIFELGGYGSIQFFWALAALRAIRLLMPLSRWSAMGTVLRTLRQMICPLIKILVIGWFIWLVFALMGVQLFNGKFFKCLDENGERPDYRIVKDKIDCEMRNYTWVNSKMNFDHTGKAFLSLLQVGTFFGWITIMSDAIDSRGLDEQPHREVNFVLYLYFVLFIIYGALLTRGLLTSVIINVFSAVKNAENTENSDGNELSEYEKAVEKMKARKNLKVIPPPTWKPQAFVYRLVMNRKFDAIFTGIIILNVIVMSMDHYQQAQAWEDALTWLNVIFIIIFIAEAIIKIFALRCYYFTVPWNVFDFFVVVLAVLGLMLSDLIAKYFVSPTLLRVVRIARFGRLFSLFRWTKGVQTLVRILKMAFPYQLSLCVILFLVMYVYAILGVGFFKNVQLVGGLDASFNFRTFGQAMVLLFQISTGAGWDGLLDGLGDEGEDCMQPDPEFGHPGNCGNPTVAITYLVSFLFFGFFIILNMAIAVIFAIYYEATTSAQEGLTEDDFEMYETIWAQFDSSGTKQIRFDQLPDFLHELDPPFRALKPNKFKIAALDIPILRDEMVQSSDVLDALVRNFFTSKGLDVEKLAEESAQEGSSIEQPVSSSLWRNREEYSARLIQNTWKGYKGSAVVRAQISQ